MKLTRIVSILILLHSSSITNAQAINDYQKDFQLNIQPTTKQIILDGILDEPAWKSAIVAKDFTKKYPNNIGNPKQQTEYVPHENKWSECLEVSW